MGYLTSQKEAKAGQIQQPVVLQLSHIIHRINSIFICYSSLPPPLHFTILFLDFPFSSILCFLIGLCCGNESACTPGDVSQLHPKPVPGWDAGVLSVFPQKGSMPCSLRWTDVDSSKDDCEACCMDLRSSLAKCLLIVEGSSFHMNHRDSLFWSNFPLKQWFVVWLC